MSNHNLIFRSAALALLLLSSTHSVYTLRDSAHAARDVNLDDLSYTEKLQAVKDGLAGKSAGSGIQNTLLNVKDKLTGTSFDTQAARDTLIARLQPTLFERVQQKLTGHPTTAERIQGAINDVAGEYGVDSSVLQSYASAWGLTADNLLSKSDEIKRTLLSKTEPTLIEKIRQKLTGHPTNTERLQGAINDVASEYGVDPDSLRASAAKWGLTVENLQSKAQDIKDALLSKTEPTIAEKLKQRLTGHPTTSERATGAISELATEYGVHPDNIYSIASAHGIELPTSASDAKDTAVEHGEGLWSKLSSRFSGTKVAELMGSLSPEEREARLRKVKVKNEAHDALDEALEKLYKAHGDKNIQHVDVDLHETGKTFGARLSELSNKIPSLRSSDDSSSYLSSGSSTDGGITDKLTDIKNRILSGSLSKQQLEESVGADPTLYEKIKRSLTGHPTDAERAQGAASTYADKTGIKDTVSSYYDSIRAKTAEYTGRAQQEVEPSLYEKIQQKLTGHPTDAERAQGAASNLAERLGVKDTADALAEKMKGASVDAQNKAAEATDATLLEKIQRTLTGHPTDAERAQGAAANAKDDISSRLSDTLGLNKEESLTDKIKHTLGFREPTLSEKLKAAAEDLQLKAQESLKTSPSTADKLKAAAADLQARAKNLVGVHEDTYADKLKETIADLQTKAKAATSSNEPTVAERLQATIDSLTAKTKQKLGYEEPSTMEKIKGIFSKGDKVTVDREKLEAAQQKANEAKASVKAAKKSASEL